MRLFDVATVVESGSHWPNEGDSRACAVSVIGGDVCDWDNPNLQIVTAIGKGDPYRFLPFGIEGKFTRKIGCARDDDETWFKKQLDNLTERAVMRALIERPYDDAVTGLYMANPTTDFGGTGTGFVELRETWFNFNVGDPVFFVSAEDFKSVKDTGLIKDSEIPDVRVWNIWGEPVVVSSQLPAGKMYATGEITVYLGPVENFFGYELAGNIKEYRVNRLAAIDTAPCSIISATPTP